MNDLSTEGLGHFVMREDDEFRGDIYVKDEELWDEYIRTSKLKPTDFSEMLKAMKKETR